MTDEKELHQVLSAMHNATLTHWAWLASFIIALFAFVGLAVSAEKPL
jgi:hypothetical protein